MKHAPTFADAVLRESYRPSYPTEGGDLFDVSNFKIARVSRVTSPKIFDAGPPPDHFQS